MQREDDDIELEDGEQELVAKLRALPPEGIEPDWKKLEAAIRAEVGDAVPRPWWRNWKWIVPIWALATTAAVALIVVGRGHHEPVHQVSTTHDTTKHEVVAPAPTTVQHTEAPEMWLDGEAVDIDDIDDSTLDSLDQAAREAMGDDDVSLEELDDAALDRVEAWLEQKRS